MKRAASGQLEDSSWPTFKERHLAQSCICSHMSLILILESVDFDVAPQRLQDGRAVGFRQVEQVGNVWRESIAVWLMVNVE